MSREVIIKVFQVVHDEYNFTTGSEQDLSLTKKLLKSKGEMSGKGNYGYIVWFTFTQLNTRLNLYCLLLAVRVAETMQREVTEKRGEMDALLNKYVERFGLTLFKKMNFGISFHVLWWWVTRYLKVVLVFINRIHWLQENLNAAVQVIYSYRLVSLCVTILTCYSISG